MAVRGINHINIRTLDVATSARFYRDVLGMDLRLGPLVMGQQAHWLHDAAGDPIIHFRLIEAPAGSTGPIDHVALNCTDVAGTVARLEANDVPFAVADNLVPGLTQIFLRDSHGVALELNFTQG